MAVSNRDRVGRGFELLAAGLEPYVDRRMRAVSRSGTNWVRDLADRPGGPRGPVSTSDPALLLRAMADGWERAFSSELSRSDRNLVFELRDVRNRWAHNESFSASDAHRALDSMERLLASVDAPEAAEVGRARDEVMRLHYEAQARRAAPTPQALATQPVGGLTPWREVIEPHDDVARGDYQLAEFAADLHQVAAGEGAAEYADPVEFFRRTYLTAGLRGLLRDAVTRLTGRGGPPVVDLQTNFGGGKTHSMIALYHLCSRMALDRFPSEVQELVAEAGAEQLPAVRRAVLVGTWLSPGQPIFKEDGTEVRTLWGELAWQLGGRASFDLVADADRTGTNPGAALRDVLAAAGPCLVLIDEWVAYARILYRDDTLPAGTFDTHFSFAQMLTEAARSLPSALVVVSIPASDESAGPGSASTIEVGGVGGREALRRLRSVIGRVESSWRPATADESFEIVRRRLFQPIPTDRLVLRDATARALGEFYRSHAAEFPVECREPAYVKRIESAYPIHPELFARLYEDWSTLDRFQRTRGVLRLMATVVHALWAGQDASPVILPAAVPLSDPAVGAELTRNLEDNWKPIIDTDVDGTSSLPRALDDEVRTLGRYGAARRVARTVFLGSAPLAGSPNQGLDATRVRLGCALPGEAVATYGDALNRLVDRATYFYAGTGRYWYGTQPGVGRLARDRAARLLAGDRHEVLDEIGRRLAASGTPAPYFTAVHVTPAGPGEVRDEPSARLVILPPDVAHRPRAETSAALTLAESILAQRAGGPRDYRNMLVFLAADDRRVDDLLSAGAESLAWSSVCEEAGALNLSPQQQGQARDRAAQSARALDAQLAEAYQVLLVPGLEHPTATVSWAELKADGPGTLVERAGRKLAASGALYHEQYAPVLLRLKLDDQLAPLWADGAVTVGRLWDAYARYLYLHRLRDSSVLASCVAVGAASTVWADEGFAVAETLDPRVPGRFAGLVAGGLAQGVRDTTLVVSPDAANAQLAAEVSAEEGDADSEAVDSGSQPSAGERGGRAAPGPSRAPIARRFYATARLDPARLARDAGRLAEEVVAHLNALDGSEVEVTVEVRAVNPGGFDEATRKLVSENAEALRLEQHGFEAE